jgi:predicted Rossmann fold nucleotide-binding protein DprA/Smf involved in DNA uptake
MFTVYLKGEKMKIAIIGSRNLKVEALDEYLPSEVSEIVSGGAIGIDSCAREYAIRNEIKLTEFLPEYEKYKRGAPIIRNKKIVEYADEVIAFWDGSSRGTQYTVSCAEKQNKPLILIKIKQ